MNLSRRNEVKFVTFNQIQTWCRRGVGVCYVFHKFILFAYFSNPCQIMWRNSKSAETWMSSISKVWLFEFFFIEKLRLVYVTLFVPWIPLCSFVCLGFSPRMILIAEAIFVSIVDTTLSVSSKAYVLIYLPCLESVTGSIWRNDGRSDGTVVLQCVEFADWLESSCKCVWWPLLEFLQLCLDGIPLINVLIYGNWNKLSVRKWRPYAA